MLGGTGRWRSVRRASRAYRHDEPRLYRRTRRALLHVVRAAIASQARPVIERAWFCFTRAIRLIPGEE